MDSITNNKINKSTKLISNDAMNDVNARFRSFIEKTGFSPSRFAVEIRVNHESINRIVREHELLPSIHIILSTKIRFPYLNVNHLLTGEDRLIILSVDSESAIREMEKTIQRLTALNDEKDSTIGNLAALLRNLQNPSRSHESL